jgi:hypothetical protein
MKPVAMPYITIEIFETEVTERLWLHHRESLLASSQYKENTLNVDHSSYVSVRELLGPA